MNPAKSLEENIDTFNGITISLANIDEEISEENQAILILNSLPESHNDLKTTMKYGRQTLTLEDVLVALRYRNLELKKEKRNTPVEGLHVRGKPGKKSKSKGRNHSMSKSKDKGNPKRLVCWLCKQEGHPKRLCLKRGKGVDHYKEKVDNANLLDGYESGEGLIISEQSPSDE